MGSPSRPWILKTVVAVIAVLAQIILAPYITIGPAEPNFMAIAAIAIALAVPGYSSYGFSFGLGLGFDLLGGGPVGTMALTLVVINALAVLAYRMLGNDTLFMSYVILFVGLLAMELLYGILLLAFGFEVSFGAMLVWRVLPCTLYNCLIGLALYPVIRHFAKKGAPTDSIPTASVGVHGL